MGYDYNECVICYLRGCGNNPTTMRSICAVCIEKHHDGGNAGRVPSECMHNPGYSGKCDLCHRDRLFTFYVGVCQGCIEEYSEPMPTSLTLMDRCGWEIKMPTKTQCIQLLTQLSTSKRLTEEYIKATYGDQTITIKCTSENAEKLWYTDNNYQFNTIEHVIDAVWRFLRGRAILPEDDADDDDSSQSQD
jgi:hypothetical protein